MRARVLGVMLALGAGCGGEEPEPRAESPGADSIEAERLVLPPSAAAPRASLPARTPDTLRPDGRPPVEPGLENRSRRRAPDELDVDAIVDAYRRYYRAEFHERDSSVRGDVDPELVEHAKRRVALDWGYVRIGAWDDLTGDMLPGQRDRLHTSLASVNRALAAELHEDEGR